jgi:hypothetical protein
MGICQVLPVPLALCAWATCVDGSEGVLSNLESHTLGSPASVKQC